MKKTKYINSVLLGSLLVTTPLVTILTSCNKQSTDHIELVKGNKEIFYTDKTKAASLIFRTNNIKDIDSLRVKAVNVVVSGVEVKPVAGLITHKKDSAGNIAVVIHVSTFKAQWPNATITFGIRFTAKDTGLDQTFDGFYLSPVEAEGEYEMGPDAFDVMASPEHQVTAGSVYTYTCNFPNDWFGVTSRYKYFSFIKTKTNDSTQFVPIQQIRITKNTDPLIETVTYQLDPTNSYVELIGEDALPKPGDKYIFEVVYAEDGYGKFLNAARQSCLDMDGTVVKGFRADVTDEEILEEFTDDGEGQDKKCITFYSHITGIGDYAFNNSLESVRKIPDDYDSVSFIKSTGEVTIGAGAFAENTNLVSLYLPLVGIIKSIGVTAFAYCTNLTGDLDFAEGLESVAAGAFNHCESVTSLTIPSSCTTIGNGAFSYMSKLKNIDFSSWTSVPTMECEAIFKKSGNVYYAADNATIWIAADQDKTAWQAWLDKQGVDWTIWHLKKVGE